MKAHENGCGPTPNLHRLIRRYMAEPVYGERPRGDDAGGRPDAVRANLPAYVILISLRRRRLDVRQPCCSTARGRSG